MEQKKISIRTDLAIEAREMICLDMAQSTSDEGAENEAENEEIEIEGVKLSIEEEDGIRVTTVEILDDNGAGQMGKPIGKYITIESEEMKTNAIEVHETIIGILAQQIKGLHQLTEDSTILVAGLGNWNVTPDALGPMATSQVLVTRHLANTDGIPKELANSLRAVCAITPGVMGITGMESTEIIKAVTEKVQPDLVIAIDALAARKTNRVNSTIQLSNTGISPGAGVGNKRMALNEESLGVPVISIGVPTVVDAATLVNDTMDKMLDSMISQAPKGTEFYGMLKELGEEEKYGLISEILTPYLGNMFVTPKEVDSVMKRLSGIIGNSINIALHPGIGIEDINRYVH